MKHKSNQQLRKFYFQYAGRLEKIKVLRKENDMLLLRIVKLAEDGYSLPLEAKVVTVKQTVVKKHLRKGYSYLK